MKKINLAPVKKMTRKISNWIRRHDAELCFAGAAVAGTAAIITAIDATDKTRSAVDIHRQVLANELNKEVDPALRKKKQAELYCKTGLKVVANWTPTALLVFSSYGLGFKGYHCMNARVDKANLLAQNTLKDFTNYRNNVKNKFGENVDRELLAGTLGGVIREFTTTEIDKDTGEVKEVKEEVMCVDPNHLPEQTILFTRSTSGASEDCFDMDLMFVKCTIAYMSDLLAAYGVYTVHEALMALNLKRTAKEKDWGWRYPKSERVNIEWKKVYIGDPDKPYNAANNRVLLIIHPDFIDVWNEKDPKPVRKELMDETKH